MTHDVQCHIDDEIARLMSLVYQLRFKRDNFSSISRFPAEILAEIFICGARGYHKSPKPRRVPSWVNFSYVCRSWRIVALECSTLWSYLFLSSTRWTEELLARSKQMPLKVATEIDVPVDSHSRQCQTHFFEKLADHAEFIQEFRIHANVWDSGVDPACFAPFQKLSMPRLQVLELSALRFLSFTQGIFNGETPSLRSLKLENVSIPLWSFSPRLEGLRSLDVRDLRPNFRFNVFDLQFMLSSMSNITYPCLHEALQNGHRRILSKANNVDLSHLSCLSIVAPLSAVVTFLSRVNISPTTEINLLCEDEDIIADNHYSALATFLTQRFHSSSDQMPSCPTIHTLTVDLFPSYYKFVFIAHKCDCHLLNEGGESCGHNIPLRLTIDSGSPRNRIAINILCSISPRDVQSITIKWLRDTTSFWLDILRHFQELRTLEVFRGDASVLFSALSRTSPDGMEQEGRVGSRLLCAPFLEELVLEDMWFAPEPGSADTFSLRTTLSIRKEHGRPLKQLVVSDCELDPPLDPKDILELVSEVYLDDETYSK